jgi:heme/copper-type cytochrome/quinol oxidase subunit 2
MRGVTVFVAAPPKNASQPAAALPLDAASAPDDASAADRLYGTLNLALWGLLALFLLIFVWMVFTAIRRAKTKSPPKEFH